MSDSQEHASKRGPAKRLDSSVQIHISLISLMDLGVAKLQVVLCESVAHSSRFQYCAKVAVGLQGQG